MNSTESLSAPASSCLRPSVELFVLSLLAGIEDESAQDRVVDFGQFFSFNRTLSTLLLFVPHSCFCSFLTAVFVESSMTRLFAGTPFDIPPRCDRCGELEESCQCEPAGPERLPPEKQTAKVRVDRRKHKRMVTVVWGLDPVACDLAELLSTLKAACGSGGSLQDDEIELQGDHLTRVKENLRKLGYKIAK